MPSNPRASRRRWSTEFKRRVVAEAAHPDASAAEVARRYDLNDNLIFNWKKKFGVDMTLLPVEIVSDSAAEIPRPEPVSTSSFEKVSTLLEIDLPGGARLRCGADIDAALLVEILNVLRAKP